MSDPIEEFFDELIDRVRDLYVDSISEIEDMLAKYGLMIVPIEDPTNLRFGIED